MFSKKHFIISAILLIALAGCQKLDLGPTYKDTDLDFWKKPDAAFNTLNNCYAGMYSDEYFFFNESLSDNAFCASTTNGGAVQSVAEGVYNGQTSRIAGEWAYHYGGIRNCNNLLDNIDKVPSLEATLKKQYIAEAKFIRAFHYFYLMTWYGDVPLILDEISFQNSYKISRSPKADVLKFVLDELDAVLPDLPIVGQTDKGRITKGAVMALKARVQLYENNWQEVINICSGIMSQQYGSYGLFSSYAALFQPENENNKEVMLDMEYVPVTRTQAMQRYFIPFTEGTLICGVAPSQELVDDYIMLNGKGIKENGSAYNENDPYKNRDPRFEATLIHDGSSFTTKSGQTVIIHTQPGSGDNAMDKSNASPTGYYVSKYYDRTADGNNNSGLNLILIRYADILLMYAEAKAMLGQFDQTVWDNTIKQLRIRAGFTDPLALDYSNYSALSNDQKIALIRRERRCEFAIEGLRIFDIRRWKTAEAVLNSTLHGMKVNGAYKNVDTRVFDKSKHYLWPVPQTDIDMNANLKPNNPGWN